MNPCRREPLSPQRLGDGLGQRANAPEVFLKQTGDRMPMTEDRGCRGSSRQQELRFYSVDWPSFSSAPLPLVGKGVGNPQCRSRSLGFHRKRFESHPGTAAIPTYWETGLQSFRIVRRFQTAEETRDTYTLVARAATQQIDGVNCSGIRKLCLRLRPGKKFL